MYENWRQQLIHSGKLPGDPRHARAASARLDRAKGDGGNELENTYRHAQDLLLLGHCDGVGVSRTVKQKQTKKKDERRVVSMAWSRMDGEENWEKF